MPRKATPTPTAPTDAPISHAVLPVDALAPHDRNYRRHPDTQISRLSSSLMRFSQVRSIVVQQGADGRYLIVAGHGVVEAARRNGLTELHADVIPATWTPQAVEAYLISDNETARGADDDLTLLAEMLQEQANAGESLEALGYNADELDALLAQLADAQLAQGKRDADDPDGGGDDFDTTPDADGPTRCQPGDLWQLGAHHRLLCGDSTNAADVARLMGDERADMMWTDPPYGVNYVGKTAKALTIKNDGTGDLNELLRDAFACADSALSPGAAIYIAHPAGAQSVTFGVRFLEQGWRLHETLVWVKDSMVLGHSDYHYRHEPILFGYTQGEGRRGRGGEGWYGDNSQTSVFEIPRPKRSEEHPTMKPIALPAAMIANSSDFRGSVYEPFCGSGTTLIACERLGRRCYALEIDPHYVDVILSRYEAETGQTAVRLSPAAD